MSDADSSTDEVELLALLDRLCVRDEFAQGRRAAAIARGPAAAELLELWQIFTVPYVSDKYEEVLASDLKRSLFGRVALAMSRGEVSDDDLSRLLLRVSPLRRRANFGQRELSWAREKSVRKYKRALMKSCKQAKLARASETISRSRLPALVNE